LLVSNFPVGNKHLNAVNLGNVFAVVVACFQLSCW